MRALRLLGYFFAGVLSAGVGLGPWLLTGMRLPLQNLWAADVSPAELPVTLLPFSQYAITLIVAVIVVGSAIAGGVARVWGAQRSRFALLVMVLGVLAVQVTALAQTTVVVSEGLRDTSTARTYLVALAAGTGAAILVGMLVLVLLARAPAAGAVVAMSLAAVSVSSWLAGIVLPFGVVMRDPNLTLLVAIRWIPAVIVGLAVVWSGVETLGRVIAAIAGILAVWIGPAAFTAVSAAVGSRVLAPHPAEMVDYGWQLFVGGLGVQGGSLPYAAGALVVMVIGLTLRSVFRRPRRATTESN